MNHESGAICVCFRFYFTATNMSEKYDWTYHNIHFQLKLSILCNELQKILWRNMNNKTCLLDTVITYTFV